MLFFIDKKGKLNYIYINETCHLKMSEQKLTVYQKLQKVLATGSVQSLSTSSNSYNIHQQHQPNDIVDIARSPQEKDF